MAEYESIRIYPKTKSAISKLSEKWDMSQVNFLQLSMEYFQKTGVDPRDSQVLSPAEELKKFRDTIISFMRKQEKDYILPVFGKMDSLITRFLLYIEEEAPRKNVSENSIFEKKEPLKLGETEIETKQQIKVSENIPEGKEVENLKNDLVREQLKVKTIKDYFDKVLNNVEYKSTGLTKKPVIELPMSEIEDIKKYLKRI